jgi:dienelactone hydrolase
MNLVHRLSLRTLAVLACFLLPHLAAAQPAFPDLKGPYNVGRIDLDVLDANRAEVFTEASDDKRRLLVTLYYPAEVPKGVEHDAYTPPYLTTQLPLTEEQQAWTSSGYADVPVRDGSYPVLLFSPGFGNMTFLYSSLLYNLASEGYVVAALWHPYGTSLTAFPDGTVIMRNEAGSPQGGATREEQLKELERVGSVWSADMRFVADQLQTWNATHPLLQGHLDMHRLGAFGHSLGGAASVQAAYEDERFLAAIDMDGTMFGEAERKGSRVPLLFLKSDPPSPSDEQLQGWGITRAQFDAEQKEGDDALLTTLAQSSSAKLRTLENSRHNTYFTDHLFLPLVPQEQRPGFLGNLDPASSFEQIRTWVSDFMAVHVKQAALP